MEDTTLILHRQFVTTDIMNNSLLGVRRLMSVTCKRLNFPTLSITFFPAKIKTNWLISVTDFTFMIYCL